MTKGLKKTLCGIVALVDLFNDDMDIFYRVSVKAYNSYFLGSCNAVCELTVWWKHFSGASPRDHADLRHISCLASVIFVRVSSAKSVDNIACNAVNPAKAMNAFASGSFSIFLIMV